MNHFNGASVAENIVSNTWELGMPVSIFFFNGVPGDAVVTHWKFGMPRSYGHQHSLTVTLWRGHSSTMFHHGPSLPVHHSSSPWSEHRQTKQLFGVEYEDGEHLYPFSIVEYSGIRN